MSERRDTAIIRTCNRCNLERCEWVAAVDANRDFAGWRLLNRPPLGWQNLCPDCAASFEGWWAKPEPRRVVVAA